MDSNQNTDIHAAYLHWMEEASAYQLAALADCGTPNSKLSPGAEILGEVRDAVIQRWRAGRFDYDTDRNDDDLVVECAEEGIIPVANHEIVALFADLAAWTEESEFTERGKWEGSFIDMFKDAISQITERAARAFIAEVRSDFDQNFICPECGDTGTPHVCYPGDCRGDDEEKAAYAASLAVPAEATLPTEPPVSDPIPHLIVEAERAEKASPGDETAAFLARMDAINSDEFGNGRRYGTAAVVWAVGWLTLAVGVVGTIVWGLTR